MSNTSVVSTEPVPAAICVPLRPRERAAGQAATDSRVLRRRVRRRAAAPGNGEPGRVRNGSQGGALAAVSAERRVGSVTPRGYLLGPPPPKPTPHERLRLCVRRLVGLPRQELAMAPDAGMSTAEYAVGTVAACGFAALLYKVVTSSAVADALSGMLDRALHVV